MRQLLPILLLLLLLAACGTSPPPQSPVAFGTVVGYTETTTGNHVVDINLFDKPAGAPPPYKNLGYAHEGQRVDILEQRDDGTIKVRTPDGIEGWTQTDFVKDIKPRP
jgi:hypothetical protein